MAKKKKPGNGAHDVGYGKPPKHTQFKKGQSGNPSGKAKKKKTFAELFEAEGEQLITVTENGVQKKITKLEVAVKALFSKACKGDHKALTLVMNNQPLPDKDDPAQELAAFWSEEEDKLLKQLREEADEEFEKLLAAFEDDDNVDI